MKMSQVLGKATSSGSGVIAAAAVGFGLTVVLSRTLPPQTFGAVAIALTWATIGSQFAQLGLLRSSTKIVATTRASDDSGGLKAFLIFALAISTFASCVGSIALLALLHVQGESDGLQFSTALLAAGLLLPMTICRIISGVLLGESRSFIGAFSQTGLPSLGLLIGLFCFLAVGSTTSQFGLFEILVYGAFAATLAGLGTVAWRFRDILTAKVAGYPVREWLSLSLPLMIVGGMQLLNRQIGVSVLGSTHGPEVVAAYYPALRISDFALVAEMGINAALAAHVAVMYKNGQKSLLQATLKKAAVVAFSLTAIFVFCGIITAPWLLSLFGGVAAEGVMPLRILLFGQLIAGACGSVGMVTAMTGQERFTAATATITLVLNLGVLWLMVPDYAAVGAAIATAFAAILWNFVLLARCRQTLKVDPSILSIKRDDLIKLANRLRIR
ncbi:MAG: hypothetical protein DI637_01430 [Citromicrobium sp.]|nr:MAG: hypothetical protein DI637_01430 [Citromicrobium sp.]